MTRPRGRRNADYPDARRRIVERIADRLRERDGAHASLRELAQAAGVSLATVRHYLGDRAGAIRAVLEHHHQQGADYLRLVAAAPLPDFATSIHEYARFLVDGLRAGVGPLLQMAIDNGRADPAIGRACLSEVLEPTLQALEIRLERHIAAGEMRPAPVRVAALALVSPIVLALLHQDELDGATYRPLDLDTLVREHAEAFVRAWRS